MVKLPPSAENISYLCTGHHSTSLLRLLFAIAALLISTAWIFPVQALAQQVEVDNLATPSLNRTASHDQSLSMVLPVTGLAVPELAAFDEAMQNYMSERSIEAGLLAVMKDGVVVLERGYGWKDEAHTTQIPPDALMRIASVTKPITNAAIQRLIAQGELSVDDYVFCLDGNSSSCWLTITPFGTPDSRLKDVTIQHLLDHQGGWDRELSGDPMFDALETAEILNVPSPPSQQDTVRYMMGKSLDHTPGTTYAYSNFGYLLLGLIIEEATGQDYTAYIQDQLFAPLGVSDTEIELGRTLPADRNQREPWYDSVWTANKVFPPHNLVPSPDGGWYLEAMEAHGGLISTPRALLAFAQAYWFNGLPREENSQDWYAIGSLDGTYSMLRWRPDGVNIAVIVNSRDQGPSHHNIKDELDAVANSIEVWPGETPVDPGELGKISGRVTDVDGNPLAELQVAIYGFNLEPCCPDWQFMFEVATEQDGRYVISGLQDGTYRVAVYDNIYPFTHMYEYYDGASNFEGSTDILINDGEDVTEINFALEELGKVSGTVTNSDGNPLSDVPVTLHVLDTDNDFWVETETVYTDGDGNYLLSGIATGNVRIRFGPGYFDHVPFEYVTQVYQNARFIDDGTDIPVSAGSTTAGIDAQLVKGSKLSGQVTDAEGNPLPDMEVNLNSFEFAGISGWTSTDVVVTDQEGKYAFGRMEAGTYRISAFDITDAQYQPGFYDGARTLETATNIHVGTGVDVTDINIQMERESPDEDEIIATCSGYNIYQRPSGDYFVPDFLGNLIVGTSRNDTLTGTDEADMIVGLEGNDDIGGLDGEDLLCGGSGNDKLYGGPGIDNLVGGDGNDLLHGGEDDDYLEGGAHFDDLYGDKGHDHLLGGPGFDILVGGANDDTLYGGLGQDGLFGYAGDDFLSGDDGNDHLNGGSGHDTLDGGYGNDKLLDRQGDDNLYGGPDRDKCIDLEGANTKVDCELGTVTGASVLADSAEVADEGGMPDFEALRAAILADADLSGLDEIIFLPLVHP